MSLLQPKLPNLVIIIYYFKLCFPLKMTEICDMTIFVFLTSDKILRLRRVFLTPARKNVVAYLCEKFFFSESEVSSTSRRRALGK